MRRIRFPIRTHGDVFIQHATEGIERDRIGIVHRYLADMIHDHRVNGRDEQSLLRAFNAVFVNGLIRYEVQLLNKPLCRLLRARPALIHAHREIIIHAGVSDAHALHVHVLLDFLRLVIEQVARYADILFFSLIELLVQSVHIRFNFAQDFPFISVDIFLLTVKRFLPVIAPHGVPAVIYRKAAESQVIQPVLLQRGQIQRDRLRARDLRIRTVKFERDIFVEFFIELLMTFNEFFKVFVQIHYGHGLHRGTVRELLEQLGHHP